MKETIKKIERQFLDIREIMGDELDVSALEDSRYLDRLSNCIDETYIVLNQGMCEELEMCHTCAKHRDILGTVMETLNDLDSGANITDDVILELKDFVNTLDDILVRIKEVLHNL